MYQQLREFPSNLSPSRVPGPWLPHTVIVFLFFHTFSHSSTVHLISESCHFLLWLTILCDSTEPWSSTCVSVIASLLASFFLSWLLEYLLHLPLSAFQNTGLILPLFLKPPHNSRVAAKLSRSGSTASSLSACLPCSLDPMVLFE